MPNSLQPLHQNPPVTRESVEAAKLAQQRERAEVTRLTGVTFPPDDDLWLGVQVGEAIVALVYPHN